jgi:hypothetical protein
LSIPTEQERAVAFPAETRLIHRAKERLGDVGLLDRPIVTPRYFPRRWADAGGRPTFDELVRCISSKLLVTNIWIGEGGLVLPERIPT